MRKPARAVLPLVAALGISLAVVPGTLVAGDLAGLRQQKDLTPETLMRHFADFSYELGDAIQEPEHFLRRKRGDCDDFARLAALLLTERGYKARIVAVMMERETHVVCYLPETGGFLDFNHRDRINPISECADTLESIAEKVAAEFRSRWRMVSEVRYEKAKRIYVKSVFHYAPVQPVQPAHPLPSPNPTAEVVTAR